MIEEVPSLACVGHSPCFDGWCRWSRLRLRSLVDPNLQCIKIDSISAQHKDAIDEEYFATKGMDEIDSLSFNTTVQWYLLESFLRSGAMNSLIPFDGLNMKMCLDMDYEVTTLPSTRTNIALDLFDRFRSDIKL